MLSKTFWGYLISYKKSILTFLALIFTIKSEARNKPSFFPSSRFWLSRILSITWKLFSSILLTFILLFSYITASKHSLNNFAQARIQLEYRFCIPCAIV